MFSRGRQIATVCLVIALAGCMSAPSDRWMMYNEDGVQLFAKGDYRNALDSFDYALTFRPQDPVLIYNAAQCYDRLGDTKHAEELYGYCIQRDPKHGDARLALVSLKYRTGRAVEANQQILEWLQKDPNAADGYVADAWRLRQEKAYPLAQRRLQQALSLDGQNRLARTEMAILYELQGMPERSLVLYQEILARDPNQLEIAERAEKLRARGVRPPLPN
ncbi:MAG: tetratricopeptide repeat protein [Planctomycetes bacterium]|nr:tetratricopeptide repeat protein [Planctomycetota bacterium]